jgi:pantoate--beta-alanine ligase
MGALHEGHISLFRAARSQNDVVFASIFVNPTQFGANEDLDNYPRRLEKDIEQLASIGVDHVFAPSSSDVMYGKHHVTYVEPTGFETTREGRQRPDHFRGVATIVTKLFNIVRPSNAYFGQKDAVQCVLIRRIVEDLNMNDINVHIMDTVREDDGLAMSSRNAYLDAEQRRASPVIYKALCAARELYDSRFSRGMEFIDATVLQEVVEGILKTEPLISTIQYVAIDDAETMQPLAKVGSDGCIVSLACILGTVRLIDNIVLK